MEFIFDIKKAVSAVGCLCSMNGGKIDVREMLKMLYVAERAAILGWQRSITGDRVFAMDQGPVLSRVYDLARYKLRDSDMDAWKATFTPRHGHTIFFQKDASWNDGPLSDREVKELETAFQFIRELQANYGPDGYIDELHKRLREWENPRGSSVLMQPETLLSMHGLEKEEIESIAVELNGLNSARIAMQR